MNQGATRYKVLIIDDMPVNINILVQMLQDDYVVLFAKDGETALGLVESEMPDLILLDILMPHFNGYEVCKRLKANAKTEDIPVIFITSLDEEDDETKGFDAGAVDFISKPFKPAVVKARVKTHLKLKKQRLDLKNIIKECRLNEDEIRRLNARLKERVVKSTVELKVAQEEIIEREHKSELANITSVTLHNVKNLLNSVKISSHEMGRILDGPALANLKKANSVVRENIDRIVDYLRNNPKGDMLMHYYLKIEDAFNTEVHKSNKHYKRLLHNIFMIEKIITAQQTYSGGGPSTQLISPISVIEDALVMQMVSIEKAGIKIIKKFNHVPDIYVDQTKFIHVIVNLIKNATEAMQDLSVEKRLTISTDEDPDYINMRISDSGIGISSHDMTKMFSYGFTTKKNGHGFGLHSCASYIEEMGGKIWAESKGLKKGATFIVQIPYNRIYQNPAEGLRGIGASCG